MARDGQRKPRRPRIELVTPAASPQEAAAITAAVERFLAETAPPPAPASQVGSRWQRAGLLEAVNARAELGSSWGSVPG
jgi:hypothetical protein